MEDYDLDSLLEWDEFQDQQSFLLEIALTLADSIFISNDQYLPREIEGYNRGHLEAADWWLLVNQLSETVDLSFLMGILDELTDLLPLPGLPSEALEDPLGFLSSVLAGNLPLEPSGRRVGSPKLVKIAQAMVRLLREFPDAAQAAVRAWADVHRGPDLFFPEELLEDEDITDLLFASELPPAMAGFSMMLALTLMYWPERAEGLPLPPGFADPEFYDDLLAEWEALPDNPTVTEEGAGEAEALFAQGQLAHMLAQTGMIEIMGSDEVGDKDTARAYSRLSRAILWIHNACRQCSEREGVACKVATGWPEHPVPLLDVAGEIANTGHITGCIKL